MKNTKKRRCEEEECITILSIHNQGKKCFVHGSKKKFDPLRVMVLGYQNPASVTLAQYEGFYEDF